LNSQSVPFRSTIRCYATTSNERIERFRSNRKETRSLRNSHGNLAEFGPAFFLFLALILLPIWALIRFGATSAAVCLIVTCAADAAAKAPSYGLALSGANKVLSQMITSPIGRVTCLRPEALKCLNLYVNERITASGETNVFGPDKPVKTPICATVNSYEYEVRAYYSFEPLLPAALLPGLQRIPLLSEPLTFPFRAVRAVEYPDGLSIL
jgi:hypothetical protein